MLQPMTRQPADAEMLRYFLYHSLRKEFAFFVEKVFRTLHSGTDFIPNWHIEAMCHALDEVHSGQTSRLLITVPPRHLKSIVASVAFPAWCLGHDPSKHVIVSSYGQDLAVKHGQDCRTIMQTAWYKRIFPNTRLQRETNTDLKTTRGGRRQAASLGGAVTGFGADIIVVDDIMKAGDAFSVAEREKVKDHYDKTLVSRLNDKAIGSIIVVQQRLHEDDLPGYLLESKDFAHLNLPAIAVADEQIPIGPTRSHQRRQGDPLFPARESMPVLEALRKDIGESTFSAQYQQEPVTPGGNLFRWDWVKTYPECPDEIERSSLLLVVQSWDTAHTAEPTSNYSVCTTWGLRNDGCWLLLRVDRQRLTFPDLKSKVLRLAAEYAADHILIERAASGIALHQDIVGSFRFRHNDQSRRYVSITPRVGKEERFASASASISEGKVLFPSRAPWLADLRNEMVAFPVGKHDDQVDSVSMFLNWLSRQGKQREVAAMNGGRIPRRRVERRARA